MPGFSKPRRITNWF